jgi:hypothetical protein
MMMIHLQEAGWASGSVWMSMENFSWTIKVIASCCTNYVTLAAAILNKAKVQFTLEQAIKAQRGSGDIATLALTSALDGGGW